MNASDETSTSLWMSTHVAQGAPTLSADVEADVIVVGSGIAGLSIAYELGKTGKRVAVVDRGRIGGGMTSRTTAHLATAFDDYYHRHIAMLRNRSTAISPASMASCSPRVTRTRTCCAANAKHACRSESTASSLSARACLAPRSRCAFRSKRVFTR
jgi:glycine/D-amino acid oxidase-like deaminating enzyme